MSSRQVIAVAEVHTNLKVSESQAQEVSHWWRCQRCCGRNVEPANVWSHHILCHHWSTEEHPRETYWGIFPGAADIWCFNWAWIYVGWRYSCCWCCHKTCWYVYEEPIIRFPIKISSMNMLDQRAETRWNSINWKCPDDVSNAVHYWRSLCISEHGSRTPNLLISDGYEFLWETLFFATEKK